MTRNISPASALWVVLSMLVLALAACSGQAATTPAPDQTDTDTPAPGQTVTVTPSTPPDSSTNTAPDVGAEAEVARAAILQLRGSVSDDVTPVENLIVEWTQVSGPGPVEFADPSIVNTTAAFTMPGTYVLRLTASDGQFTTSDEVTVVVQP